MKYITDIRFRTPKDKRGEKLRKDMYEFLELFKIAYGGVTVEWFRSEIPSTIFGTLKNSVRAERDKANHAVVRWQGEKLLELYSGPSRIFGYKLNGYLYDRNIDGINSQESNKVEKMLDRYNMKVYTMPFVEYGVIPLVTLGLISLIFIVLVIKSF